MMEGDQNFCEESASENTITRYAGYLFSLNEEISTGSLSLLEVMVILMSSILNGVDCNSEAVHGAYSESDVFTVDLPWNVCFIMKTIHVLIDLFVFWNEPLQYYNNIIVTNVNE